MSQDSERTISEATVGETVSQVDQAVVESHHPAVTMVALLADPATMASKTALVLASSSTPPSLGGRQVDDRHLTDEVLLEFDATQHLGKASQLGQLLLEKSFR